MAELHLERRIDASPALLWKYISTPSGLACWQADRVEGSLEEGFFSLRWPQLGARLDLSVAATEPLRSLALRAGDHVVSMRLEDTSVTLCHGGLHEDDDLVGLESSWHAALSLLEIAASTHPSMPRSINWLFQPVQASAELAHYYFTDPRALGQWLGNTSDSLTANAPFSINCDGTQLSGVVLWSGRDVCLKVRELGDGALTFRTLPAPRDERVVAVGVSCWGHDPDPHLAELLEGALLRLSRLTARSHG